LLVPNAQAFFSVQAVDAALDLEQCVDTPDRLQRDRGDRSRILAPPCIGGDVRQFEELSPGMGPAQRDVIGPSARAGSYSSL